MSHKSVTSKRATFTKAEREYVKGMVHNLSVQRLSDREIVDWLYEEKQIDLDRSTVSKIRNQAVKDAEAWYTGLRNGPTYIATYKQRLDSLLSYQKRLHELINNNKNLNPELTVRAISELHRIELSLHTLMKELPGDITTSKDIAAEKQNNNNKEQVNQDWNGPKLKTFAEWYDNVRELGLMTQEITRTQYDAYVKEWNNNMFGPDNPPRPKSILSEESEQAWDAVNNNNDSDSNTEIGTGTEEEKLEHSAKLGEPQLSTEIDNDSEPELEETIQGPGQKHALGIRCTQCHRIYLNRASYNKHECMRIRQQVVKDCTL
jgi:hypothetical protein